MQYPKIDEKIKPFNLKDAQMIPRKIQKLRVLLKEVDMKLWDIGDMCGDLKEHHRLPLRVVAELTGFSKSRLSELKLTSQAFPPEQRNECTFQDAMMARRVYIKWDHLGMSLVEIRRVINKLHNKRPRQILLHFATILYKREMQEALESAPKLNGESKSVVNSTHHADWRDVIEKVQDGAVKLVLADPPYGGYKDVNDGAYDPGDTQRPLMRTDCDYETTKEAIEVTVELFSKCKDKLTDDGVLVLFQPGNKPDRIEVLNAAKENGWECKYSLTWSKGVMGPGAMSSPYCTSSEKILIFVREKTRLKSCEQGLDRLDVINVPPVTKKRGLHDLHMFQKPHELMELLIRKHTYPGDLVVEPFGCSGAGCIAAAELKRKWIYVESNQKNFIWGSQRIENAMK